jgi:hypothetical protein
LKAGRRLSGSDFATGRGSKDNSFLGVLDSAGAGESDLEGDRSLDRKHESRGSGEVAGLDGARLALDGDLLLDDGDSEDAVSTADSAIKIEGNDVVDLGSSTGREVRIGRARGWGGFN